MTTKELKNKVIRKINQIDDDEVLNEIYRMLDDANQDEEVFQLSGNHKKAIEEAKSQIESGEFLTNKQVNQEIGKWLNK
ncbi:MAG: hypothetical protein Q8S54_17980 [Bacteroidota bacterium]|nr:hypothetical protein [Odoribacter sp.]MDP3645059.1 hypothetical protein [Bacteroidota bacterium]